MPFRRGRDDVTDNHSCQQRKERGKKTAKLTSGAFVCAWGGERKRIMAQHMKVSIVRHSTLGTSICNWQVCKELFYVVVRCAKRQATDLHHGFGIATWTWFFAWNHCCCHTFACCFRCCILYLWPATFKPGLFVFGCIFDLLVFGLCMFVCARVHAVCACVRAYVSVVSRAIS